MAGKGLYLGREYDLSAGKTGEKDFRLDADDLTTHAVVFGMTGSGKTGLCIDLLEEAVDRDLPMVIIDPKGDVADLALLFPDLSPADFLPWVSAEKARREGLEPGEYAGREADRWRGGLEEWGVTPQRMRNLKARMELRIFTPGSSAGLPVNLVDLFHRPEDMGEADSEAVVERITNAVSALLSLLDIDSDPLKSQPHILISHLVRHFWESGRSPSLEDLILAVQKPPFRRLGMFDVNRLLPEAERVGLALRLNNIVAAPSFRFWSRGRPLDGDTLFSAPAGRVPVNLFYIAHLPERERMFFVSLVMNALLGWVRSRPGAPELRQLVYMDEVFGYLPPYPLNPPSKRPLLLLLKQARAYGMGLVLVTQNPKDIDYKALTNMGTWFVGKLQADGDRERVLEGMKGVSDGAGGTVDSVAAARIMAALDKRVFLVRNVHEPGLQVFHTRWAMSYLAGPLTRQQIETLTGGSAASEETPAGPGQGKPSPVQGGAEDLLPAAPEPGIPLEVEFEAPSRSGAWGYAPRWFVSGEVVFDEESLGLYIRRPALGMATVAAVPEWELNPSGHAAAGEMRPRPGAAGFRPADVPLTLARVQKVRTEFRRRIHQDMTLEWAVNRELNLAAGDGESPEAFRQRCRDVVEKMADKETETVRDRYHKRLQRLAEKMEREKIKKEQYSREHKAKQLEEVVSLGESLLGLIMGSRSRRGLSTAARRRRMTAAAGRRREMGETRISQLQAEAEALKAEMADAVADIEDRLYARADAVKTETIRLEENDIVVRDVRLRWIPFLLKEEKP